MVLPIPIILGAGRAVLSFSAQAASLTVGGLGQIANAVGAATGATAEFAKEFFEVSRGLQALLEAGMSVYNTFLGTNEQLNQSLLKSQTILSQTLSTYDVAGNKVDDLKAKINSFGDALRKQQKVLEQDTKELVGVTSQFTLQVFDNVLQQFGQLQGQTKKYATDLEAVTKLSGNITAALGTLNLKDQVQVVQETRALLLGELNNPDSLLGRSLGISKEQFAQAKAQGKLVDVLNEKLEPFRAGNALGAVSITNEISNIQDAIQIFTRTIGEGFDKDIAKSLNEFRLALEKAFTDEQFISKARETLGSIINVAKTAIGQLVTIGQTLKDAGVFDSILDTATITFSTLEGILDSVGRAANATKNLVSGAEKTLTGIVNKVQTLIDLATKPIIITVVQKFLGKEPEPEPEPEPRKSPTQLPKDPEFTQANVEIIKNKEVLEQEVSLTRKLLGGLADAIRGGVFFGKIQEGLEEDSNEILTTYSKLNKEATVTTDKLVKQFDESAKKFEEFSANESISKSIEDLKGFDSAVSATETSVKRLNAIDTLLSVTNSDDTKKALAELRELEENARVDNVQARERLTIEIQAKLKNEAINTEELAKELQANINKESENLEVLIGLRPKITGGDQRKELEKEIATAATNLGKLKDLADISGLTDVIQIPNESLGPNADRLSQLTTRIEGDLATIQRAVQDVDRTRGVDSLFGALPEAVNAGAIDVERAKEILKQLAESKKLTFEQQIQAEKLLTQVVKIESQKRIDSLATERNQLQSQLSTGEISQTDFNVKTSENRTQEAIANQQRLQEELDSLLRISNGIETNTITALRQQVAQQTEAVIQARANEITVAYQSAIAELEQEAQQLQQFSQLAEQRIEAQRLDARGGQGLTDAQAQINAEIEQRNKLKITIEESRMELEKIQALQAGLSEPEQQANQQLILQKQTDLLTQQNLLAQSNLSIQQNQNNLILDELEYKLNTIKTQRDISNLQELIATNEDEAVSYAQEINEIKLEELEIITQIQALDELQAASGEEQRTIDTKRLALQKQLLENQLSQKRQADELDKQKEALENRLLSIEANKLSLANKELELEKDKLDLLNKQLQVQKELAKEAKDEATNKIAALEAALDRLVEEGRAPREAARRRQERQEQDRNLSRRFVENRLTGSAEEQSIKQQLAQAKNEENRAIREERKIAEEEEQNRKKQERIAKDQALNESKSSGLQANKQILDLTSELEDLNAKEKALAERGLLTSDERESIKAQKDAVRQEINLVTGNRRVELEKLQNDLGIEPPKDESIQQNAKRALELAKDQELENASEVVDATEELAIQTATINIAKANIEGLMQEAVNNAKESVPSPSEALAPPPNQSPPQGIESNSTNTTDNSETVNITNNWGSLLDNRALARTRGL